MTVSASPGFTACSLPPPWGPHHPLDVVPATSDGAYSRLCFPQDLWDLGRQDWAPIGRVSKQWMDKPVLPKTGTESTEEPPLNQRLEGVRQPPV